MKHHIGTLQTMIAWFSNIYFRLAKNQSNYIITLKIQYWHKPRISAENAGHWLLPNADIQWLPITGIFSSFCYRLILACHISFPPKVFLCSFRNSLRWIHKYLLSFSLSRKKNITNNSTYFNFKYKLQLLVLVLFYFSILYPMQPDFKQLVCVYHWKQFRGDKTPIPIISTAKKFLI